MKNFKQTIRSGFFILSLIFSANSNALTYMEEAEQYFAKGEYKAAIIQLKNRLKENPKDASARLLLGKSYLKIENIKQANKEINKAYRLNPENEKITLAYAQLLLLKKDYSKLNKILAKKFIDTDNENQRLIYQAHSYVGQNQLADARQILMDLSKSQENIQVFNGLAKIAVLEKEMDEANKWLDKTLKKEPNNIQALQTKAAIEVFNKDYSAALNIYNYLIKIEEKNLNLYLQRAKIKAQLKDISGAEQDVQGVLNTIKNHPQANYILSQINLQEKNYKEAQAAAQKVLNIVPRHFDSMLILGIANFGLGNYHQADKYLTQYLSANPDNIVVQTILANVYLAQKNGEQALLILEGIDEEKRSKNAKVLMAMGSAYILLGEHQKGIDFLSKAKTLSPDSDIIQKRLIEGKYKIGDMDGVISGLESIEGSEILGPQSHYLLIVSYIQKKEFQKAQNKLRDLIQKTPDDPTFYNLLAIIEILEGRHQKAEDAYNKAIEIDKKFIPAYVGLAQMALQNKNIEDAKKYYKIIISLKKDYVRAYIALASIAERQNDLEQVETLLLKAYRSTKNVSDKVKMALLISKLYAKQKQVEKVTSLAKELSLQYPDDLAVMSFSAGVQIANKQVAEAQKTLRKIIYNKPLDVQHRILLTNLLSEQEGTSEEALELLDEVSNINPDDPKGLMLKSVYLIKLKQYFQAMRETNKLVKQFPEKSFGHRLKGDIFLTQKQFKQALNAYQKAYQIQADTQLLNVIVELMKTQEQDKELIALLQSELTKNSKNIAIHFKLANIYQQQKQIENAIVHYKKMLEIQADNVLALNNLAGIYLAQNNPEAIQLAKRAYDKIPESASIIDTYGYIQVKQGDMARGIELLEKAVSISPESYDIVYHLAEGYALKGDKEKAKTLLEPLLNEALKFSEKDNAQLLFDKL